jgi:hypothetical protein
MNEEQLIQPENTVARLKLLRYEKGGWQLNRYVWENPSDSEKEITVGLRVWPAGEDEKSSFIVKAIKSPGEKFYPEGGIICTSSGADRTFFPDAVIKHPSEDKPTKKKKSK